MSFLWNKPEKTLNKLIVSGNSHYGLSKTISERYPKATFASRTCNDLDLTIEENQSAFAEKSLQFDTYISCSALERFHQILLLEKVINLWKEKNHQGRIIVLGSRADTANKPSSWVYPIEKKGLKAYCAHLSLMCLGGHGRKPMPFRITYLSVGNLNTPHTKNKYPEETHLDLNYIVDVIEWITKQPFNINLNEISIDPIQRD